MQRLNYSNLRALYIIVIIALSTVCISAQSPIFTTAAPSAISSGGTLTITLPITNSGAATAPSVALLSIQLSTTSASSPSTFPASIGDVPASSTFSVDATFNSTAFTAGTKYLLNLKGTYLLSGNSQGFAVNRYVTIPLAQSAISAGVQVLIPAGFQVDLGQLSLQGPISMDNFGNRYQEGGVVPLGGGEIDITRVPLPSGSLSEFIFGELAGANIISNSTVTVAGTSAMETIYSDQYSPSLTLKEIAVYIPHGNVLYKAYLSYNLGDPSESTLLSAFKQVLFSIQFKS